MASPSLDSTEKIFVTPAPFTIHIKAQNTLPSRSVDYAVVIIHRRGSSDTIQAPDGVALLTILKGDELEIQGPKNSNGVSIFHTLFITLTDITSLHSLTVYLKFVEQYPNRPKDHNVFGIVYNDSRIGWKDVDIHSAIRNITIKSSDGGNYSGMKKTNEDFDLKFSIGGKNKAELQLKGVKDTLQLDVFLDDNTILEGG